MSSLKAAAKGHQRTHRERGQLEKRKHLGHLEKHKDYVARARDYHKKEKTLKTLQKKARDKNPDEFYFRMISEKTKEGVHVVQKQEKYSSDQMKLLKTQDMNYVNLKRNSETKKIEKLNKNLHLIGDADATGVREHIFFVDSKTEVENFDAAKRLNTLPELLSRVHNRPTIEMLHGKRVGSRSCDLQAAEKEKNASYRELALRMKRETQLEGARQQLELKRQLMGKGSVTKRKCPDTGKPVYRWKKKRTR